MKIVFQVEGCSYSPAENSVWIAGTFEDRFSASRYCEFLTAFLAAICAIDKANGNCDLLEILRAKHPYDKGFTDNGTIEYKVIEHVVREKSPISHFNDVESAVNAAVGDLRTRIAAQEPEPA